MFWAGHFDTIGRGKCPLSLSGLALPPYFVQDGDDEYKNIFVRNVLLKDVIMGCLVEAPVYTFVRPPTMQGLVLVNYDEVFVAPKPELGSTVTLYRGTSDECPNSDYGFRISRDTTWPDKEVYTSLGLSGVKSIVGVGDGSVTISIGNRIYVLYWPFSEVNYSTGPDDDGQCIQAPPTETLKTGDAQDMRIILAADEYDDYDFARGWALYDPDTGDWFAEGIFSRYDPKEDQSTIYYVLSSGMRSYGPFDGQVIFASRYCYDPDRTLRARYEPDMLLIATTKTIINIVDREVESSYSPLYPIWGHYLGFAFRDRAVNPDSGKEEDVILEYGINYTEQLYVFDADGNWEVLRPIDYFYGDFSHPALSSGIKFRAIWDDLCPFYHVDSVELYHPPFFVENDKVYVKFRYEGNSYPTTYSIGDFQEIISRNPAIVVQDNKVIPVVGYCKRYFAPWNRICF